MERPELKQAWREGHPASLGDRLVAKVRRLKSALRLVLWLERALLLVLMLLGAALLGLLFILYAAPSPLSVWVFTFCGVAVVGYVFLKFVYARRRRSLSDLAMSVWVERAIPGLQDRLITAMEFSEGVRLASGEVLADLYEPSLVVAFYQQTEEVIRRTFLGKVLLRRRFFALASVLMLALLLFENSHYFSPYTAQDLQRIYLDTHLALLRGQGAVFVVEPGDATIARGEDLAVKAYSLRPGRQRDLEIFYRAEGQSWESSPMNRTDGSDFDFLFQQLSQPLEYFVTDAQAESDTFSIRLADRPELASLRVQLMHPAYTGLGTVIGPEGQGEIEALAGTRAKVVVQFRQTMEKVELSLGTDEPGSERQPASQLQMTESAGSWKGEFVVRRAGWYRLDATNPDGYSTGQELTYSVRLLEDATPQVEMTHPTKAIDFLRTEEFPELRAGKHPKVPIRYEAKDDFGIARVELHYAQRGGVTAHRILAEYGFGEKAISGEYQWDVESLWGRGSVIYHLRVYDHVGVREEQETGQTEHYGESGRLELFWGLDRSPPPEESPEETAKSDEEEGESGQGESEEEQMAQGLGEMAEQLAQLRQQQERIDEAAEQGSEDSELSSNELAEDLGDKQEQLADDAAQVRRQFRSKAREARQRKEVPQKETKPEDQDTEPQSDKERKDKLDNVARRVDEVADALEEQRIEETSEGFKTRSGVEGEMRLNRQRLEQGRLDEAGRKGRQLEKQLAQLEQELRQLAQAMAPAGEGKEAGAPSAGGSSAAASQQQGQGAQDAAGNDAAGNDGGGIGSAGSTGAFDDYRPSQWDPPPMKDLGRRAPRLGEFIDAQPERDPFGDTPPEERYPLKYEGLVEQYFQALTDSGP